MDEYRKCIKCRNCDPTERNGYKVYCERYGTYEDPDEIKKVSGGDADCKSYQER